MATPSLWLPRPKPSGSSLTLFYLPDPASPLSGQQIPPAHLRNTSETHPRSSPAWLALRVQATITSRLDYWITAGAPCFSLSSTPQSHSTNILTHSSPPFSKCKSQNPLKVSCEAPRDLPPPPFPLPSDLPDLISHTSSFPLFLQQAEHCLSSACMHLSSPLQRMSSPPGYLPYPLYTNTFSVGPSLATLFVSLFCKIYLFFPGREKEKAQAGEGQREEVSSRRPTKTQLRLWEDP